MRGIDHRRRGLHRLATSESACRRTATRSSSTTTSAPAGASSSPSFPTAGRRDRRGRRARRGPPGPRARGCDAVFHLQANADVRHGLEHPRRDLEQNTLATSTVLEAMRARASSASPSPPRARSTASPRCSRRPRTALSDPDLALRRLEAGRRGPDRGLLPRSRIHGRRFGSSRCWASATPTATSSTSTRRCGPTRSGCASSATGGRRRATSTCATASMGSCARWILPRWRARPCSTSAPTRPSSSTSRSR